MAQTFEEKQKARLVKQIGERIIGSHWYWRGTHFINFAWCGVSGAQAYTKFTANYNYLEVNIDTEGEYNIPNQVNMFSGENALEEAVNWAAERLLEIYKTVSLRAAPYEKGHLNYLRAVKGQ